jgi:uncharacterized membrane protein
MTVYYDNQFNQNEWFIIILLIATYTWVFLLPKRFPVLLSVIFLLYGIAVGHFLDHTISVPPFDYYDVNDNSSYQFFDFLSYLMYGPFSYSIVYFFDKFNLKKKHILFYIALWSLIALSFEWLGVKFGVYHYNKGYKMQFSYPAYLAIITILITIYYKLCKAKEI